MSGKSGQHQQVHTNTSLHQVLCSLSHLLDLGCAALVCVQRHSKYVFAVVVLLSLQIKHRLADVLHSAV